MKGWATDVKRWEALLKRTSECLLIQDGGRTFRKTEDGLEVGSNHHSADFSRKYLVAIGARGGLREAFKAKKTIVKFSYNERNGQGRMYIPDIIADELISTCPELRSPTPDIARIVTISEDSCTVILKCPCCNWEMKHTCRDKKTREANNGTEGTTQPANHTHIRR